MILIHRDTVQNPPVRPTLTILAHGGLLVSAGVLGLSFLCNQKFVSFNKLVIGSVFTFVSHLLFSLAHFYLLFHPLNAYAVKNC